MMGIIGAIKFYICRTQVYIYRQVRYIDNYSKVISISNGMRRVESGALARDIVRTFEFFALSNLIHNQGYIIRKLIPFGKVTQGLEYFLDQALCG
jgi:hypothetical protein